MPIHHDDAVGTTERGPGRADVDARRMLAVLAHHRQRGNAARQVVLELDLANPARALHVPVLVAGTLGLEQHVEAVFPVTRTDAIGAAFGTLAGVDQHAVAHTVGNGTVARSGFGNRMQEYARSNRGRRRGTRGSGQERSTLFVDWLTHYSVPVGFVA